MEEYREGDLEKFMGIDPDFTGDMPTSEYLDQVRGVRKQIAVETESCSPNTPPLQRLSYTDNVREFLSGRVQFVTREIHGYKYFFIGIRQRGKLLPTTSEGKK